MWKQKVVIWISMKDQKARNKAVKIAVSYPGVNSASIQAEKGQLEVVGDVDAVALASLLRKRLGQAQLLSVEEKEEKEQEKKAAETRTPQTVTISNNPSHNYAVLYPCYVWLMAFLIAFGCLTFYLVR